VLLASGQPRRLGHVDRADGGEVPGTGTIVLEMGRVGKFYAKASGWETNRAVLEGQKIEIWVDKGHWFHRASCARDREGAGGAAERG
jgi:hypothetical protein